MTRIRNRIIRALMILSFGVLPTNFIECDLEDGVFEIDLDELDDNFQIDFWFN